MSKMNAVGSNAHQKRMPERDGNLCELKQNRMNVECVTSHRSTGWGGEHLKKVTLKTQRSEQSAVALCMQTGRRKSNTRNGNK